MERRGREGAKSEGKARKGRNFMKGMARLERAGKA
jgi:hypothetical protein